MKTADFNYSLPESLIAGSPANPRDHSRLMVINKNIGKIEHKYFYNIVDYLSKNDVLVLNNTKVFPARFFGKKNTGGKIEVLLIEEVEKNIWKALTKPGIKPNQKIKFGDIEFGVVGHSEQTVLLKSEVDKIKLLSVLEEFGVTPIPPYIKSTETEDQIRKEYQTVYAKVNGSVAAPTAGLHFTPQLLEKIKSIGVQIEYVTLHVGLGTFAPVKTKTLEEHKIHSENFEVDSETILRLNKAKTEGKRILSVGTTTTRVLETLASDYGILSKNTDGSTKLFMTGATNLFIIPPYKFKFVDCLITNFHLPESTLLSLVSAFVSYPNTNKKFEDFDSSLIGKAYKEAIKNKYRFYSFGDASIII